MSSDYLGSLIETAALVDASPHPLPEHDRAARDARQTSELAIRYAAELAGSDREETARRLYAFNKIPPSPELELALGGRAEVARSLIEAARLQPGAGVAADLRLTHRGPWLLWLSRRRRRRPSTRYRPKLYVSPKLDQLFEVVQIVAEVAYEQEIVGFKFGRDLANLSRPDRIVMYFHSMEDLREAARTLGERWANPRTTVVPFTAPLGEGLGWGVDPPAGATAPNRSSWRMWICAALADAIHDETVRSPSDALIACSKSLARHGVDSETWVADGAYWLQQGGRDA